MREIGGYIELDRYAGSVYHEKAIALNCGRASFEYLIRSKNITKVYLPYFCCDSVAEPCRRCNIKYEYYHINPDFRPIFNKKLKTDEWLYIVNFYGQLTVEEINKYKATYNRIIIDNAQAYFQMPVSAVDTIYTCRKFFGVSDGAFLYTDAELTGLEQDESFERVHYILGRFERTGSEFYAESAQNNQIFETEPLKKMSKLTENLLRGIDYDSVSKRRTKNFRHLHNQLKNRNKLKLTVPNGAFMYPFYTENGAEIRKVLQSKKIYIPTLWPDVFENCRSDTLEYKYAENILPLPIDQRYNQNDMDYIIKELLFLGI